MLPVIAAYDSIPPGTKNNAYFDNNATDFDAMTSFLGSVDYAFGVLSVVVDSDLAVIKFQGKAASGDAWTDLVDLSSQAVSHTTKTNQKYIVGISLVGPTRRFLRWYVEAGNGTASYAHGEIIGTRIAMGPANATEMGADVYGEVL